MSLVPSSQTIYGNLAVAGAITSFTNQVPTDSFGQLIMVQRTMVIDLKSVFGISVLRDTVTTAGTGSVTNPLGNPEFQLTTTGASDTATLQSAERGRYVAGFSAICGIACRIPAPLTGNQVVRFGYTDGTNGFYYLYNASGMNVAVVRNGVETIMPQATWNVDKMDGTGPSGRTLDMTRGQTFQVVYSWYGFGAIVFNIVSTDNSGVQIVQTVHRWAPSQQTSVTNPNLPISVSLTNGGTAATANVYIAGRQFSLFGQYSPISRISATYGTYAGSGSTLWVPLISVKRKTGAVGVGLKVDSFDITSTQTIIVQMRVNATLTGAAYGNLQDVASCESMLQSDSTATAMSGGTVIYTTLVTASSNNAAQVVYSDSIKYNIPEFQPLTICAKMLSGSNNYTVTMVARFREEY